MRVIEVKNLSYAYFGASALEDVSFKIKPGAFTGVLGPNGGGKTTLVKLILGLLKPQSGQIKLFTDGWAQIGYMQQRAAAAGLMPLSAFEVARLGLLSTKKTPKIFNRQDDDATLQAMQNTGCAEFKGKLFYELSGGQQQRVLLARALINKPRLLILDEPSTALDSTSREVFFELLSKLNKQGVTILLITHDIGEVGKYVDSFLILDKRLVFHGGKQAFCASPEVTKYFGPYTQHIMDHLHHGGANGVC
ncbi:MAG: metal ABC transporter ATP-binding protein [Elusimicrobiota bacterium]|jgi:zinc transport system ATP-binding protein|nr:metal ABC transporter ATP-binding protein [Elusimicrobiota bacterium]